MRKVSFSEKAALAVLLIAVVAVAVWLVLSNRLQAIQRTDCENAGGEYVPLQAPRMLCLRPSALIWQVH